MKPVIYTFGYSGWGPHVLLMKEAFIRHNMAVRGRSLKWLDTRLKRSVRAMGFRDNKPEELLGREHYRWIPEFGNVAIERGGRERLKDFEKGLSILREEVQEAQSHQKDLILFCHDEEYECCHRRLIIEMLREEAPREFHFYKSIKNDPEWPPQDFTKLDLSGLKDLKVSPVSARIPVKASVQGVTSPLTVASGTQITYRDRTGEAKAIVSRVVPSADEKWAVWRIRAE